MSTRSAILITDGNETLNIYKHNDGYPQGAGNVRLIKEILSQHIDIPSIKESFKQENPVYPSQGRARIESSFDEPLKPSHFGEQSDLEFVYLLDLKNKQLNIYGNNIREHTQDSPLGTPLEHLACGPIDVDKFKTDTLKETLSQYKEQALDDILELKNDIQLLERVGLKVNKPHEIELTPEVINTKKALGINTAEQAQPMQALPVQAPSVQETSSTKKSVREQVVEKIIDGLENNKMPWQKTWANARPYNPVTGTVYKGTNALLLGMSDFDDPRFMTFKQANEQGFSIKKGEKGTHIIKVIEYEKEVENIDTKETETVKMPALKMYTVFNASQIEGIPPLESNKKFENIESAEKILNLSGAKIKNTIEGGAYYSPSQDEITLPLKQSFKSETAYYAVALHELSHWTGHKDRLDRDLTGRFGSESYAKEELRAEFASAMVCADLGLTMPQSHIDNHSAYIKSWVSVLKENPSELFKAVGDAEKISDYVLSFDKELQIDRPLVKESKAVQAEKSEPATDISNKAKSNHLLKENDTSIGNAVVENAVVGKMYGGKIIDIKSDIVLQQVNKDRIIAHNANSLNNVKVGDKVQIYYGKDKVVVTNRNKQLER